jgi:hypothetical protein
MSLPSFSLPHMLKVFVCKAYFWITLSLSTIRMSGSEKWSSVITSRGLYYHKNLKKFQLAIKILYKFILPLC